MMMIPILFCSHDATRVLGLGLLSLVSEEFVRPDSPLPDVRKKELRAALVWAMPSVLHVLAEVRDSWRTRFVCFFSFVSPCLPCSLRVAALSCTITIQ